MNKTFNELKHKIPFNEMYNLLKIDPRGPLPNETPTELCEKYGWQLSDVLDQLKQKQDKEFQMWNVWNDLMLDIKHIETQTNE